MLRLCIHVLLFLLTAFEANAALAENPPLRIASLGDSYSKGKGIPSHESWPSQLAHMLNQRGHQAELTANLAHSGSVSTQVLERQVPILKSYDPQWITLQIGVNDWVQGFTSARYRKSIVRLLDSLLKIVKSKSILIVTAPEFSCSPSGKKWGYGKSAVNGIQRMNRILVDEANKRKLSIVDIFPLSRKLCLQEGMFSEDGWHPSAKQYKIWAQSMLPTVLEMLKSGGE